MTPNTSQIQWKQLISLSTLYASITIGWIAYYNYQPKLLAAYNFQDLTLFLFIAQGIILVITPPIAGILGDRMRKKSGSRMPIISAGISFAAMIFMSVAFTVFTDPGPGFKNIIPVLIVLWLFSMALFTSPAISTIELFAPREKLPTAMAILTIVTGLLYSLEPVIVDLIDLLGPSITFMAGGVAVLLSGFGLKKTTVNIPDQPDTSKRTKSDFFYVILLAIALGTITTVMFNLVPGWLISKDFNILDWGGSQLITVFLVIVTMVSFPLSILIRGKRDYLMVAIGLIGSFGLITLIYFTENNVLVLLAFVLMACSYALMAISFLPMSLSVIDENSKVFGVGLYYAGFELPNGILEAYLVNQGLFN